MSQPQLAPSEYLDIEAAAVYLGVSPRTVYRLIDDPTVDLQLYRIAGMSRGNRRLRKTELDALLRPEGDR